MEKPKIAMMRMTHGHTRKYYDVLRSNPKLDRVAVSTENEEVRRIFLNSVSGIPRYDSDEAMLDAHPEIEAVVIASANSRHFAQMKLCAERGIHILSMKIPTFDMEEYDRKDIEVEDMLSVVGKMKNGVVFSLDPSWSNMEERLRVPGPGRKLYPKRMEVYMTASCENGSLVADLFGPNVYHNGAPNDRCTVQYAYFDEQIGLIDEFVENIRLHLQPMIDPGWHKDTIRAMNAVYESIASGKAEKL